MTVACANSGEAEISTCTGWQLEAVLILPAQYRATPAGTESIRGKSDLSPVIASKELPSRKGDLLSGLPEVKDPVEAVADVLGDVVDKKVGGVEAYTYPQ
ncbi:unnamed protein product [Symbiodinium sp. KB8]|nr:unnamed protein product [Symbiodinium sp. KB8]